MTKWPSWEFQQTDDDTLQQLAKYTAGAEVMYESSALTEIECKIQTAAEPIAPFELNKRDYSSPTRLLRVTTWALRVIRKLQEKSTERRELTVQEISQLKLMWETYIQKSNFDSEIHANKSNKRNNSKVQLGLEMDENGLLRCHRSLVSDNLPQNTVYPKLRPKNNEHYQVALSWRHDPPYVPNNRVVAERRGLLLKKRLLKDDAVFEKYKTTVTDYVEKGHAEKISNEELEIKDRPVWYLPHHPVTHPLKTDKGRAVYDCATEYGGTYLHQQLLQGPDQTKKIIGCLKSA